MMRVTVIAASARAPAWVDAGFKEYADRVRGDCTLQLRTVAVSRRRSVDERRREEGESLLAAIPAGALRVALDMRGSAWKTRELATRLEDWRGLYRDLALLIGGPDGLSRECLADVDLRWSLSPLTLPHALVRVIVAEQIYRAWSFLHGHPYHRED